MNTWVLDRIDKSIFFIENSAFFLSIRRFIAGDYTHSLLPTENRSEVEVQSKTRNAQMLVTRSLSAP